MAGASSRVLVSLMLVPSHRCHQRRQNRKNSHHDKKTDHLVGKFGSKPTYGRANKFLPIWKATISSHSVFNYPSYKSKDDDGKLQNQRRRIAKALISPITTSLIPSFGERARSVAQSWKRNQQILKKSKQGEFRTTWHSQGKAAVCLSQNLITINLANKNPNLASLTVEHYLWKEAKIRLQLLGKIEH